MFRKLSEGSSLVKSSQGYKYTELATEDVELSKRKDKENGENHVPYPRHIFFIISMEACERFTYYGMNAVLTIYLISLLKPHFTDDEKTNSVATSIYHVFKFGCYGSGLLGAVLADSFVGKYRTILYIGIVYAVGQAVLTLGALGSNLSNWPREPISFIGIFLIAFGTGGIKPCVVSLGADQFKVPEQKKQMATYFAMFYAAINIGSMVSTVVVPYLRRVECMGDHSCFSLAFGVPFALMCVALLFFWGGHSFYKITTPKENIILVFFQCSWHAATSPRKPGQAHWLDRSNDRFPQQTIDDIKAVYRVGTLFLFYPMYWALFDQQGSRWTIQAMKMNGYTFGMTILPDQMQVANPILILLLIPLFDQVVYPFFGKFGVLKTPLQKIVTGCFLCALAFVISGILELELRKGYPTIPGIGESKVIIHNGQDCGITAKLGDKVFTLKSLESGEEIVSQGNYTLSISPIVSPSCSSRVWDDTILNITENINLMVTSERMEISKNYDVIEKDTEDTLPSVRLLTVTNMSCPATLSLTASLIREASLEYKIDLLRGQFQDFPAKKVKMGSYSVIVKCGDRKLIQERIGELGQGANWNVFLTQENKIGIYRVTEDNSVHIFWLLPQYIVITIGEILFSITSMEFAYSQAPSSMKSVLQALYLMTTAVGNLITMLIVEVFSALGWEQYLEFFTFAGLMTLFSIGLMAISHWYEYVYYTERDKEEGSSYNIGSITEGLEESEDGEKDEE